MHALTGRILKGESRAIARALTIVENETPDKRELLTSLHPHCGRAQVIGFTGSPGAGKSTLVDGLISFLRKENIRLGVLAVDPSSPFSGGALLGDRVRMAKHSLDEGVYIRSVGSRGSLGGIGKATGDMVRVLDASGFDVILLETVGVGQAELDIMEVADSVILVLTPGAGDDIQAAKAGIMEIADIFVVNKCDLPGVDALVRELQFMLGEKSSPREEWLAPIVKTQASAAGGIDLLWQAVEKHHRHLEDTGYGLDRRNRQQRQDALKLVEAEFHQFLVREVSENPRWQEVLGQAHLNSYAAADKILKDLPWMRRGLKNSLQDFS